MINEQMKSLLFNHRFLSDSILDAVRHISLIEYYLVTRIQRRVNIIKF